MTFLKATQKTHPWITFDLNLERLSPDTWMLLGESRSKCDHIAGVPLKPDVAQELHTLYLAKGVHATTAIEGNTLSEKDARDLIEGKLSVPKSKQYMKIEMANVVKACDVTYRSCLKGDDFRLTPELICSLNEQVLSGLDLEDHVDPGQFRRVIVGVGNYRAPEAQYVPDLVARLCEWLNGPAFEGKDEWKIPKAIIRATMAHLYIAWIHPFGDGNGRTARLLEFALLVHAGIPTPAGHLLSNHYNETRGEYYRQLSYASASGGDVTRFLNYAAQGFVDGLQSQLARIRQQQLEIAWSDYVYEVFRFKTSLADKRRRDLVLALAQEPSIVPKDKLKQLSGELFLEYRNRTDRTLSRDINALLAEGLIEHDGSGGYRAKTEIIQAFLPFRKTSA